ncbi:MAG: BON domain-containing protein [Proteobacteria bacterium]|nr:BON domain-containing protein [Pseudomonadota bacterium]
MKKSFISVTLFTAISLSSCVPALVMGGAAGIGTAAVKEKGLGGTISDTEISTRVKVGLYQKSPQHHAKIGVNVQNGEVLLTGAVPDQQWVVDAEKIAWETKGVRDVKNNIQVSEEAGLGTFTSDSWVTTQVKSALLFDQDIKSINYSIKTVGSVVYVMGIAQNQQELNKVLDHARNTRGVKKVVNYAKIKENPDNSQKTAPSSGYSEDEPKAIDQDKKI